MEHAAFSVGRAWITLDRDALQHNVAVLRALLPPGCALMPAVKANAYGHGAVLIARELNRLGVNAFCVATVSEGVQLRQDGILGDILVLGYTHPEQLNQLAQYELTQTVIDAEYGACLNRFGKALRVHIGVDTGMHRLGENAHHVAEISALCGMKNLRVDGIFTHLCADDTEHTDDRAFTLTQGAAFWKLVDMLRQRGYPCVNPHILSSYGLIHYPQLGGAYARVGIVLYGLLSTRGDQRRCKLDLQPVLSLNTRIAAVKSLRCGEGAGYGLAFRAQKDSQIATLAIGYADGLPRHLSCGVGQVLINGYPAKIVGRICMDQTLVDVTGIPDVRTGDIAVVVGKSGTACISAYDLAEQAQTITNEVVSRLGTRLERVLR